MSRRRLAEGHTAQVLHRPEGEVGDGHQVELVGRVGNAEVLGEEPQGVAADLGGVAGQMSLARRVHDAQGDAVHVDRIGGLEQAHDEGDQVGGHDHGRCEPDTATSAGLRRFLDDPTVGPGAEGVVDDEGDLEGGLEGWLVPAGKGAAGVGRLHLGGGDDVVVAGIVGEGRPVEAVQHVVEDTFEDEVQGGRSGRQLLGEGQFGLLLVHVDVDPIGCERVATVGIGHVELGEADLELRRVEDDVADRLLDGDVDLDVTGKGGT